MSIVDKNLNPALGQPPAAGGISGDITGWPDTGAVKQPWGKRLLSSISSIKTFDSLKNSAYRFYFFGMVGQWGSMNMQMVTRSLLIYRLTGSAALLGFMSLANAVPTLALSLFGGAIADRFSKKQVIQVGQVLSAVVAFTVAIALTTGYLSAAHAGSWWILMVNAALQGTIQALMQPARQSIIPEIVQKKQVMNAVALNSFGMNSLRLIAPAVAGVLIDALGFQAIFYAMTGLYTMAVVLTGFIPATTGGIVRGNPLRNITDGLRYIWAEKNVMLVIVSILVAVVLSMPYMYMMPIFSDSILHVGATGLGILMSVSGAGAVVGSLTLATIPNKKRGLLMLGSTLILGLALAGFAFSRSMPLSMAMMFMVGVGQAGRQTLGTTMLQSYTEETYLGRVMSINMMDAGLSSLGTFFSGILAQSIGAPWSIGGFALLLVIISVLALLFIPRIRRLD